MKSISQNKVVMDSDRIVLDSECLLVFKFRGILKEYYEIVTPSIGFFPHTCGFVYINAFLLMKLSNPPSF